MREHALGISETKMSGIVDSKGRADKVLANLSISPKIAKIIF